ncbi:type IV pilus modification protein PilV [Pelagibaculum spongiae]|uniref:Type IV pilus modification protein PilV n=1 Tax=Pelagibaculum spongiae TaxID=2080658 RepID=A0A2V1H1W7_9GAMM|nr:type IV pilus modification protein PilV [Pelagibaculum spongiae]PVZ70432.1 type IV pilus modification protein PilV [Pelagibaculum spongiae]
MNKKNKGFSLLEVMITLVIIAVGMLGVAGMSLKASFLNIENAQKNEALYLANDIVNRMRANSDNASDYVGTTVGANPDPDGNASIVDDDLGSWKSEVESRLVAGTGCIYEEDGKVLVAVAWQSDAPLGDAISNIKKRYSASSAKSMVGKADACGNGKYNNGNKINQFRQAVVVNTYIG